MQSVLNFLKAPPAGLLYCGAAYLALGIIFCLTGFAAVVSCVVAGMPPVDSGPCAGVSLSTHLLVIAQAVPMALLRIAFWPYWAFGFSGAGFMEWLVWPWLGNNGKSFGETTFSINALFAIAVAGLAVALGVRCLRCMVRTARISAAYWHIAMKDPAAVYDHIMASPDWHVFTEKPGGGFGAGLPPGEWDGPYTITCPERTPPVIHAFGRVPGYEQSQAAFAAQYHAQKS